MQVQPYLFFEGRCEEALDFYRQALGAEVGMMMRYKECPEPQPGMVPPGAENKVMHASFTIGETMVMASDGHCAGQTNFQGFGLSIAAADPKEAEQRFNALAQDGKVQMPLGKTFFAASFGMVVDKFGVMWMVIAEQ